MNSKYLSLTVAVLMGCSSSAQQAKISVTPAPKPALVRPDCSSLDLTQKVGFSISFLVKSEERFCYSIRSKEKHYYDELYRCDEQSRPLPDNFTVKREFAGPNKDSMQINVVLTVSENDMDYLPFWRDSSGKITSVPGQVIRKEAEGMFYKGRKMLDITKDIPEVCKGLLEYKPKQ